ncbi:hypothetical protein GJ496_003337 [Pomphorhynchus laevis]|nr:hypothetical protein GJ496_003337 [Pomphorhynchus laevis]
MTICPDDAYNIVGNLLNSSAFNVTGVDINLDKFQEDLVSPICIVRLHFIAVHCPDLRLKAFQLALDESVKHHNTTAYLALHDDIVKLKLEDDLPKCNKQWVDDTKLHIAEKLAGLEVDLQLAKYSYNEGTSSIENVKRYLNEIADSHLSGSNFSEALRTYLKMRDYYCTGENQDQLICMHVSLASIFAGDWSNASIYAKKGLKQNVDSSNPDKQELYMRVVCCAAMADLGLSKYKNAAEYFSKINIDQFSFNQLLTPSHICLYGGICALATFTRQELKALYYNSQFRQFLELHPLISEAITSYLDSRYCNMFNCLKKLKGYLLIDIFVSGHVSKLYSLIRKKVFFQFFYPYKSVSLQKMSDTFNKDYNELEHELIQLINEEDINVKIDHDKRMIYNLNLECRWKTYDDAVKIFENFEISKQMIALQNTIRDI